MPEADRPRSSLVAVALRSSAANLALPLSSLLTGPLLARTLGPEGRGAMAALLAPISLANLAFTLGAPEAMTYFVARRNLTRRHAVLGVIGVTVVGGTLAVLVLVVAAPYLMRHYPDERTTFYLLLLTLPITLGFAAVRGGVQGMRGFDTINIERAAGVAIRVAALVSAAALGVLTATSAAWITVVCALIASVVLLPVFWRGAYAPTARAGAKEFTRYAAGSALGTAGAFIVLRLDQTLMAPLAGPSELGYYAVAVSVAELPLFVIAAIQAIVFTVATDTDDRNVPARVSRISTLMMVPICAVGCLVAPFAVPLLFGDAFESSVPMTEVLLVSTVPITSTALLGAGLMSSGRAGARSLIQIGGAFLTAALVVLLVPPFGGMGAAVASLLTYLALSTATAVTYARLANLRLRDCLVPTHADLADIRALLRRAWGRR